MIYKLLRSKLALGIVLVVAILALFIWYQFPELSRPNRAPAYEIKLSRKPPALPLEFSPDGTQVAVGDGESEILIWDVANRREWARLQHDAAPTAACFSPDGTLLAVGTEEGTVTIWNCGRAEKVAEVKVLIGDRALSMAFSSNGEQLLVGTDTGVFLIDWKNDAKRFEVFEKHSVMDVLFSQEPGCIIYSTKTDTIGLNYLTGRRLFVLDDAYSFDLPGLHTLALFKEGKILARLKGKEEVQLVDSNSGTPIVTLVPRRQSRLATGSDTSLCAIRDRFVCSAGFSHQCHFWDTESHELKSSCRIEADFLRVSPKGDVAAGTFEGKLRLFHISDLTE